MWPDVHAVRRLSRRLRGTVELNDIVVHWRQCCKGYLTDQQDGPPSCPPTDPEQPRESKMLLFDVSGPNSRQSASNSEKRESLSQGSSYLWLLWADNPRCASHTNCLAHSQKKHNKGAQVISQRAVEDGAVRLRTHVGCGWVTFVKIENQFYLTEASFSLKLISHNKCTERTLVHDNVGPKRCITTDI
jgi:hypothetical protein